MEIKLGEARVSFNFYFFAVLVLFMLLDKTGLAVYMLMAIAAHEAGHIIAMLGTGVKIGFLKFTPFGLSLERREGCIIGCGKEVIISLSGSFVNLFLSEVFFMLEPRRSNLIFAAVNIALGLFNLLPIKGLDGGNIVEEVLEYCYGQGGRKGADAISKIFIVLLFLAAIYFWYIDRLNLSLVGLCIYLTILLFRRT